MSKHGWVLQSRDTGRFEDVCRFHLTPDIKEANIYPTRDAARNAPSKLEWEVVRKVSLDKDGKAIEIIRGR